MTFQRSNVRTFQRDQEAERWVETASEDLRAARVLRADQLFAHACFMAQQCGEKAVKAMWYAVGQEPAGTSIQKLVMQFPDLQKIPDMETWRQRAAGLDKFLSATRYPNELPDLTPGQNYFLRDADQAIESADLFLRAARELLPASPIVPSLSPVQPTAQPVIPFPPESMDAKISLASVVAKTPPASLVPPTMTNVSSGQDQHSHRRRHSMRGRVMRFLTQRETWVVAIILVLFAIVLGLVIPRIPISAPRGKPMALDMIPVLVSGLVLIL